VRQITIKLNHQKLDIYDVMNMGIMNSYEHEGILTIRVILIP